MTSEDDAELSPGSLILSPVHAEEDDMGYPDGGSLYADASSGQLYCFDDSEMVEAGTVMGEHYTVSPLPTQPRQTAAVLTGTAFDAADATVTPQSRPHLQMTLPTAR